MEKTIPYYCYFDHEADVGIMAEGKTLEEAFAFGARAMFELICDPSDQKAADFEVSLFSEDVLSLWVDYLNRLLGEMDVQKIFFVDCKIQKIEKSDKGYSLLSLAQYVKKSEDELYKSEVKAATFCMAEVEKTAEGYRVQCVLDI
jgi:SHS2 domain-containing protein